MDTPPKEQLLTEWQFYDEENDAWRDAQVPGHVHSDLLRHGRIEDPFVGQNEKLCAWVDERDWSYRCRFDWHPDESRPQRRLRFEGLDTVCTVFLNGEKIAEHDNMFVPLEIDLADQLREGRNEVRVDFRSAARVGRERKAAYFAEHGLGEDTPNFDERAFVRKAQYMFGWDWGPRLVSCGIWKPVYLVESGKANTSYRPYKPYEETVKLLQSPDRWGSSFEFELNGKRLYALGANWIPDDSFPSQISPGRARQRIQQAKESGMNMLRVWGGGIYESDEFYDACDELGILVWQDFMFACSYYPDTPEWRESIRREAEHQVLRLRHHPCIALWCGNNECHQVWQDGWGGKDKQPSRFHGEVLYHEVLAEVVQRLDPDRSYVPGSPFGGDYCNQGGIGDQHYWEVWHGKGDWTFYKDSTARFCSEFGFMSSPSKATWALAGVDVEAAVENPDARWHNKTWKPFEIIQNLVELHYPRAADLEEWSYYTQLNQRDAMRAAIEHFRFSEFCRGALIWQLNDCWPVESWSLLEYEGRKKAAAHEMNRLFAPLLLRFTGDGSERTLEGCLHNSDKEVSGTARLEAYSLETGDLILSETAESRLEADQIKRLLSVASSSDGDVLWAGAFDGSRVYETDAKPVGIDRMPLIEADVQGNEIQLLSNQIAVDIFLEDLENADTTFEPNFFSLLTGCRLRVQASRSVQRLGIRCLKFR